MNFVKPPTTQLGAILIVEQKNVTISDAQNRFMVLPGSLPISIRKFIFLPSTSVISLTTVYVLVILSGKWSFRGLSGISCSHIYITFGDYIIMYPNKALKAAFTREICVMFINITSGPCKNGGRNLCSLTVNRS